jgi:hypothetical protein
MQNRPLSVLTATLAALALAAAPAMAGENDDDGDDDAAAAPVQNLPAPEAAAPSGAPQGGVATGFGGTAPGDGDDLLLGLAAGGLLLTSAGAVVRVRRRMA